LEAQMNDENKLKCGKKTSIILQSSARQRKVNDPESGNGSYTSNAQHKLPYLSAMVFSSSTKAPPQIKRISLVSTCIPPQTNRLC
jgi:hypothetical protein